jgi:hypothetical protein
VSLLLFGSCAVEGVVIVGMRVSACCIGLGGGAGEEILRRYGRDDYSYCSYRGIAGHCSRAPNLRGDDYEDKGSIADRCVEAPIRCRAYKMYKLAASGRA